MKILVTLFLLGAFSINSLAQVALSARYLSNSSEARDEYTAAESGFDSGFEVGIGYWFRLKNKRMEFTPELSYAQMNGSTYSNTSLALNANILIYPLDFHSDCDACPTFSKDGGLIKKGFYWIISPGVWQFDSENPVLPLEKQSSLTYRLGVGAGLDFGVTNLLTVSPFAMYNITGKALAVGLDQSASMSQIHLGLRATLRFDKNKW